MMLGCMATVSSEVKAALCTTCVTPYFQRYAVVLLTGPSTSLKTMQTANNTDGKQVQRRAIGEVQAALKRDIFYKQHKSRDKIRKVWRVYLVLSPAG